MWDAIHWYSYRIKRVDLHFLHVSMLPASENAREEKLIQFDKTTENEPIYTLTGFVARGFLCRCRAGGKYKDVC